VVVVGLVPFTQAERRSAEAAALAGEPVGEVLPVVRIGLAAVEHLQRAL
jgi:hypothetical protein